MSLQTRLNALAVALASDYKSIVTAQGSLTNLTTTAKASLVNAINEVHSLVSAGTSIDDEALTTSTTKTYSVSKTLQVIDTKVSELRTLLLGGADASHDTFQELVTFIQDNDTALNGLLTSVGNRVRFDASQTLTTEQQAQACTNIGIGDPEIDLVDIYNTAKVL